MDRRKLILIGSGVGVGGVIVWLLLSRKRWTGKFTDEDVEYLARILVVEAGGHKEDWPGIAWVAVNRARRNYGGRGTTIKDQVDTPRWFGSAGVGYQKVHTGRTPSGRPLLGGQVGRDARAFARAVLDGRVPSPIGDRISFVHYSGMRRCRESEVGEVSGRFICDDHPRYGPRWVPKWIVSPDKGGVARSEPVDVGRATFAGVVYVEG
jgi:hypothetical protein